MKKILLATTMLVGTAGLAAAEVTVSGDGRMGVTYDESVVGNELAFNSRARVSFSMSGETDGGLAFAASFGAHNADAASDGLSGTVSISGAFGTLAMGDTSSAAENAVGDLVGVGYVGNGSHNEMTYIATGDDNDISGDNNPTALYTYSAGDLTFMASVGNPSVTTDTHYSLAAKYSTDAFSVALGYEDIGDIDHVIGGASATFSGLTVEGIYGTASDIDFDQYGIGVSYSMDALSLAAFYRATDTAGVQADYVGVGAGYDLGGGAEIKGGVVDADGTTKADLGVTFSF